MHTEAQSSRATSASLWIRCAPVSSVCSVVSRPVLFERPVVPARRNVFDKIACLIGNCDSLSAVVGRASLRASRSRLTIEFGPLLVRRTQGMAIREVLSEALLERFGERGLCVGPPPGPIAIFPAKHVDVGDVSVRDTGIEGNLSVLVSVGDIIADDFQNYDSHLQNRVREERLTADVVQFLHEILIDRLLVWRSTDGRHAGWRERGNTGVSEPLVLDDRTYRLYVWSGPVAAWRASSTVFARGGIRDDREYQILKVRLADAGSDGFQGAERELASRLVTRYERPA